MYEIKLHVQMPNIEKRYELLFQANINKSNKINEN